MIWKKGMDQGGKYSGWPISHSTNNLGRAGLSFVVQRNGRNQMRCYAKGLTQSSQNDQTLSHLVIVSQ